jgi:hypothetical protein
MSRFLERLQYHNSINAIHNSPSSPIILDTKFVASFSNRRHWPRVWQGQPLPGLQTAQETPGFKYKDMSFLTYSQAVNSQTGAIERLPR